MKRPVQHKRTDIGATLALHSRGDCGPIRYRFDYNICGMLIHDIGPLNISGRHVLGASPALPLLVIPAVYWHGGQV